METVPSRPVVTAKGAELELDVDARGWPAIATALAVLAAALVLVRRWLQ